MPLFKLASYKPAEGSADELHMNGYFAGHIWASNPSSVSVRHASASTVGSEELEYPTGLLSACLNRDPSVES